MASWLSHCLQLALLIGLSYGFGFEYNYDPATQNTAFWSHVPGSMPITHWSTKDGITNTNWNGDGNWNRGNWNRGNGNAADWNNRGTWDRDNNNRGNWNNQDWNRGTNNRDSWNRGNWNTNTDWNRGNWNRANDPSWNANQDPRGDANMRRYWDADSNDYKWTCNTGATYSEEMKRCVWNKLKHSTTPELGMADKT